MLRFSSLASGSSGNATLIEALSADGARPTRLLVDCGLGPRRLLHALAERGVLPGELDAVFVTHEHSDHVGGVIALQRRHGIAVQFQRPCAALFHAAWTRAAYCSAGT